MKSYKYFPITLKLALIILFSSCASDNTTTVTFDLIRHDIGMHEKVIPVDSIVDRFLLLFSGKAWAKGWTTDYTTFSITISGPDITSITANIPYSATSYTIQVPSGSQRNFRLITGGSTGLVPKNWGGGASMDLAPGDDVKLTINMIPMTVISATTAGSTSLNLSWTNSNFPTSVTSINQIRIYRSDKLEGPYTFIQTATLTSGFTVNSGLLPSKTYYYKASIISTYGEGVQCDYASATTSM